MSNLYNLEPQPTAKVVLNTSSGDILLELFAKQTPLASRNFLQHCLDGYYNDTIFHRLVPNFIVQGGDPTGSGSGGISAINNGEPFQDEFHSRLKFNRRGLLGMANEGPNSNGSQFFFTLNATPELQERNTMFGRVEGDTIYNLMKMADVEMAEDGGERPLYPTKITGAEILVNPFEDMVARAREAPRTKTQEGQKEVKKRKKPAGKNVLSFGGDEGEEDAAPLIKKAKANPKLVAVEEPEEKKISEKVPKKTEQKARKEEHAPDVQPEVLVPDKVIPDKSDELDLDEESDSEEDKRKRALDRTNAEIEKLKASMKRTVDNKPQKAEKPKSALEALIPSSSTRGRRRGKATDEKGALDVFKAFKERLKDLPVEEPSTQTNGEKKTASTNGHNPEPTANEPVDEEAELCDLHFIANCQSCKAWDDDDKPDADGGDDDPGWLSHRLTFAKDTLGKDLEWKRKMEDIEVIDPREKARAIKEEKRKARESNSTR